MDSIQNYMTLMIGYADLTSACYAISPGKIIILSGAAAESDDRVIICYILSAPHPRQFGLGRIFFKMMKKIHVVEFPSIPIRIIISKIIIVGSHAFVEKVFSA